MSKRISQSRQAFLEKWLGHFGAAVLDEKAFVEGLADRPFPDERDLSLVKFLFTELPSFFEEERSIAVWNLANIYGFLCLNCWQSKRAFVAFPQNYAEALREALLDTVAETPIGLIDSNKIRAIGEMLAPAAKNGKCGFNSLSFKNIESVQRAEEIVATGAYENFLTEVGKAKYEEFEKKLLTSPEFKHDWNLIKQLYPTQSQKADGHKLRRNLLIERSWTQGTGETFDNEGAEFHAIFELFCWKYYLWAMAGDTPLLMKPSVNITPLGTQIFIPSYMSYDAKRDFKNADISKLHKAKGIQKQGLSFSQTRNIHTQLDYMISKKEGKI